jgi:hypothetical protein
MAMLRSQLPLHITPRFVSNQCTERRNRWSRSCTGGSKELPLGRRCAHSTPHTSLTGDRSIDGVIVDPRRAGGSKTPPVTAVAPSRTHGRGVDLVARVLRDVDGVEVVAAKGARAVGEDAVHVVPVQDVRAGERQADADACSARDGRRRRDHRGAQP